MSTTFDEPSDSDGASSTATVVVVVSGTVVVVVAATVVVVTAAVVVVVSGTVVVVVVVVAVVVVVVVGWLACTEYEAWVSQLAGPSNTKRSKEPVPTLAGIVPLKVNAPFESVEVPAESCIPFRLMNTWLLAVKPLPDTVMGPPCHPGLGLPLAVQLPAEADAPMAMTPTTSIKTSPIRTRSIPQTPP